MSGAAVGRRGFRLGPIGLRWRSRAFIAGVIVGIVVAVISVLALALGTIDVPIDRVLTSLFGQGDRIDELVVGRRIDRVGAALVIGFLLGVAGALTQSVSRNPIASPDILGVTTGASASAVWVTLHPWFLAGTGLAIGARVGAAAIVGAVIATSIVLLLSWRAGFDGLRLVLVGIGVNAVASALISWQIVSADDDNAAVANRWLAGTIEGAHSAVIVPLAVVAAVVTVVALRLGPALDSLRFGRDVATALGHPAARVEAVSIGVAVIAVGACTAVAGPIAFIAFVAPQVALRLFGTAGPTPVCAGAVGALLLLLADRGAQLLPVSLPTGVVTAAVGAPALLYLLLRHMRRASV